MSVAKHPVVIVPLFLLAVALLSCGGMAYFQYSQLRERAEGLALEEVMQLSDVQGTVRDAHVEAFGDMDKKKIDAFIEEMVRFKKNMVREKRQQRASIAGIHGREFRASDSFENVETEAKTPCLGTEDSGSKIQKICGRRKAFVLAKENGGWEETITDEISCAYCVVRIEEPLHLVQSLGMDGVEWSYTAMATSLSAMPKI